MNTVEVKGKGRIPMEELRIGDYVHDGIDTFSRVYSFAHINDSTLVDYIRIVTERTALEVSENHLIFVADRALRAAKVRVGDLLGDQRVIEIQSIQHRGLYAPMTYSGKIVVSGVTSSIYVALMRDEYPAALQNTVVHVVATFHRSMCYLKFDLCKNEGYTDDGISLWIAPAVRAFRDKNGFSVWVQVLAALSALPFALSLYAAEQCLTGSWVSIAAFLVCAAFVKRRATAQKVKVI
jgi:Hint module